ncbi:hypothetical protein [Haloflavibacter putidus]|uniref:DUF4175 domain-containing protein n=1 Tax=Haloflavibacter putidus TaxID=2576776 RepID=A0A507ZSX4_9FLAO|nr:hypothetical protein [Haloflavibacter putidus]TQD40730.1 hypothetical protein FKR84_01760 [Haloflavibacter putidus]
MTNYGQIIQKLEVFIRRFYVNELIKGVILFFAIGLLYFLFTVSFEYFFWLQSSARRVLFWLFVGVEIALFARFILYPVTKLFKLAKGINYFEASKIIGKHFPEVNDKLLNVLQLKTSEKTNQSELLLASIEQKAEELKPIPFQKSIDFRTNLKFLKYASIPLLVILAVYISGNQALFSDSYTRVVNYKQAYQPPAPLKFFILNEDLKVNQNQNFELKVQTLGKIQPEDVKIVFNQDTYYLQKFNNQYFAYNFIGLEEDVSFYLEANGVRSPQYNLEVTEIPRLIDFEMYLDYPDYLGKSNETLKGTGNATIPEGTKVNWQLRTAATNFVKLFYADTILQFEQNQPEFKLEKQILSNFPYEITTSNKALENYERLNYQLKVVKDQFPEIEVEMKRDSLNADKLYFKGKLSDDHGLQSLQVIYYPTKETNNRKTASIAINKATIDQFVYAFPNALEVDAGKDYQLFFRLLDNDRINGFKATNSTVFNYRKLTENEKRDEQLNQQEKMIKGMDKSMSKMRESREEFKDLDKLQKEKKQLSYNDRKKLESFLQRQKQQEKMMQEYAKQMKKNLKEARKEKPDAFNEELQERLERTQKKLKEKEKLLEEIEKYQEKLNKEQLNQKLEQLSKKNENQQKNLEQLLELTKRYYVEQKAEKIASDLEELAKKQSQQSKQEKQENTAEKQKNLNKEFEEIQKELDSLQKENEALKKPMDISRDKDKEESVKEDQEEATENLEKAEQEEQDAQEKQKESPSSQKAKQKQKNAAKKMQQMSAKMQQMMMQGGMEQQAEDAKMLRQILKNLLIFSFEQEDLMEVFKTINNRNPDFGKQLRKQNLLRENFEFIDDSLYALALRNPIISDKITEKIVDVEFNMDKALDRLAQNEIRKGVSNQQYALTGANELANMLNESLDQMNAQMQANSPGQGNSKPGQSGNSPGKGFQLPDIIKKQGELSEQMKQGMQEGKGEKGKKKGKGKDSGGQEGKQQGSQQGKQQGQGKGQGQQGDNGEEQSKRLYQIFQEQQMLRMQLEDMIRKEGLGKNAKRLARKMDFIENKLLEDGFNSETQKRMQNLEHQLLKLKEANIEQGKENRRKAETNQKQYQNTLNEQLKKAKEYFNTTEILNRQSLPLRENYKIIVQDYFKTN